MRLCLSAPVALAIALSGIASGAAHATDITLIGTDFDLTYDDTKLGLFGAPILNGDVISFTFDNFRAESLNGQGFVTVDSTISGITLQAKNGFQFGSLLLGEFGDYAALGPLSTVDVLGQVRAFDVNNSLSTQTDSSLVVNPLTPLNLNDGANHDWQASAEITNDTPVLPPLFGTGTNNWLGSASEVGLTLENRLSTYTQPGETFAQFAFIEKKFAGVGVTVMSAVPDASGSLSMLAGLLGLFGFVRRRDA